MEQIHNIVETVSRLILSVDTPELSSVIQIVAELKTLEAAMADQKNNGEFNPEYIDIVKDTIVHVVNQLNAKNDIELIFKSLRDCVANIQKVLVQGADPRSLSFPFAVNVTGTSATGTNIMIELDDSIIEEFIEKQTGDLEEMQTLILQYEQADDQSSALSAIKRLIHTTKGEAGVLNLMDIQSVCHEAETYLETCLEVGVNCADLVDKLLQIKDWLEVKLQIMSDPSRVGELEPPKKVIERLFSESPVASSQGASEQNSSADLSVPEQKASEQSVSSSEVEPVTQTEGQKSEAPKTEISAPVMVSSKPIASYDTGYDPDSNSGVALDDEEFIREFITEATDHLDTVDQTVLSLEENPGDKDALNTIFRAYHTIKGISGMLDLESVKEVAHSAENILDMARQDRLALDTGIIDVIFEATDKLKLYLETIQEAMQGERVFYADKNAKPLIEKINLILKGEYKPVASSSSEVSAPVPVEEKAPPPVSVSSPEPVQVKKAETVSAPKQTASVTPSPAKTMTPKKISSEKENAAAAAAKKAGGTIKVKEMIKVDTEVLDKILDTIGELVIAESMVQRDAMSGNMDSERADRNMRQLEKITRELQELGTSLRMTSVKPTFDKMARLVRDVAKKTGKLVTFRMEGEETELDRNVVERISDPLVHMIRNSVDHGIEPNSEERVKAGKTPAGGVVLRAFHEGGNVHIQIEDDGRGIKKDVVFNKAVEKGVISEDAKLSDEEIFNLIFAPGFSTAAAITDVSGRGVGMDVVKKNIEALRGRVKIESEEGQGTVFTIMLPLTLAIIDGMIVEVGSEKYIIPTLNIRESIKLSKDQFNYAFDQGESVLIRNELIPIYRLSRMFDIQDSRNRGLEIDGGLIVVVESAGKAIGLVVDEILGQQQIVIKNLGSLFQDLKGFSGGAIMSDGTVGLILDVTTLVIGHQEKESGRSSMNSLIQ